MTVAGGAAIGAAIGANAGRLYGCGWWGLLGVIIAYSIILLGIYLWFKIPEWWWNFRLWRNRGKQDKFKSCVTLTEVNFEPLKHINPQGIYGAFSACDNLKEIKFPALTIGQKENTEDK